jgi:fatty acid-binding protein DegV
MRSISKARGKKNTLVKILDYVIELEDNIKDYNVIIGHSDALDIANTLDKMLKEKFGDDLNTEIVWVNPTAGSHCGPSNVGVTFHSKRR